jgi:hypothetical protein
MATLAQIATVWLAAGLLTSLLVGRMFAFANGHL